MRRIHRRATTRPSPVGPQAWLSLLGLVAAVSTGGWVAGSDAAAARVAIVLRDGATITGRVVVEAQDGGVLVEHDDGRYEILEPDQLAGRPPEPAPAPEPGRGHLVDEVAGGRATPRSHHGKRSARARVLGEGGGGAEA